MESWVARKENYRDHELSLRELGARNEGEAGTEWQVLAFIFVDTVTRKSSSMWVNKASKQVPRQALINWFGRKIQLNWLACATPITVSPLGQTELGSTLKVCCVVSLCISKYSYILGKYKKWCFSFQTVECKIPLNPPAWRLGKCIPCYFI